MGLAKNPKWFYALVGILSLLVFVMGAWWLYLLTIFAEMMGPSQARIVNMVRWEGSTFLFLIVITSILLMLLYSRDLKKSRALQALFASLTHELKTPLASMRLQAEVIRDMAIDESHDHQKLSELSHRLIEDTVKFEHELDKGLQLSRVQQDGIMTLAPIELSRFIKKLAQKNNLLVEITGSATIMGDEMALQMIFRNLFENTKRHHPHFSKISIKLDTIDNEVRCTYNDHGQDFKGDRKKLGVLFYKHESLKGTGIGLHLVTELMHAQKGRLRFSPQGPLIFYLFFKSETGTKA
jgi:signal transduction histidine kinase